MGQEALDNSSRGHLIILVDTDIDMERAVDINNFDKKHVRKPGKDENTLQLINQEQNLSFTARSI